MEDSGILYVLTNPFMAGLVKIGCTTGPWKIASRLSVLPQVYESLFNVILLRRLSR
jgi:hypothetical protein